MCNPTLHLRVANAVRCTSLLPTLSVLEGNERSFDVSCVSTSLMNVHLVLLVLLVPVLVMEGLA